jgi:hypothetical protein
MMTQSNLNHSPKLRLQAWIAGGREMSVRLPRLADTPLSRFFPDRRPAPLELGPQPEIETLITAVAAALPPVLPDPQFRAALYHALITPRPRRNIHPPGRATSRPSLVRPVADRSARSSTPMQRPLALLGAWRRAPRRLDFRRGVVLGLLSALAIRWLERGVWPRA